MLIAAVSVKKISQYSEFIKILQNYVIGNSLFEAFLAYWSILKDNEYRRAYK